MTTIIVFVIFGASRRCFHYMQAAFEILFASFKPCCKLACLVGVLVFISGCTYPQQNESIKSWQRMEDNTFYSALEQTSWFDTKEEMLHLDTALNYEVLTEYYKLTKDLSLDVDFEKHAYNHWSDLQDLDLIDSSSFYYQISESTRLKTSIKAIEYNYPETLVFLQMYPEDGSSWTCGTCPGIVFILKYKEVGNNYILEGTTGRVPYSFKYGYGLTGTQRISGDENSYLLVTTDAGGIGQGREGVTIYSMEPFGRVLFSKIFITGYRGVYFLPQDQKSTSWLLKRHQVDTNTVQIREIHVNADLELGYSLNPNSDTLTIERTGQLDYHIYLRDSNEQNISIEDTSHTLQYKNVFVLR